MVKFQLVRLVDIYNHAQDLIKENFIEASSYYGDYELNVDWNFYKNLEQVGVAKFVGVFAEGDMVGYAVLIQIPSPFFSQLKAVTVNVIYLHPNFRGRNGIKFIHFIQNVGRALDCTNIMFTISKRQKKVCSLLIHMGYKLREHVFTRSLK